jgi:O-glycosyl hydrolase
MTRSCGRAAITGSGRFSFAVVHLALSLVGAPLLAAATPLPVAIVTTVPRQTLQGWGMALAWQANQIYGSPLLAPQLPDQGEQDRYMDLLYGDPAHGMGLGLNIARYNIGGGDNPDRAHCRRAPKDGMSPEAQIEGFLTEPHGRYDWSRDASQRRMLRAAKARGADVFEAFSNSPPWWMTVSGCVAGAEHKNEDNLRRDAVPEFTAYLRTVIDHFRLAEGISFMSVSPVNEPDGDWWVVGNHQEGGSASLALQEAVFVALRRQLAGRKVLVAGSDTNDLDAMTRYLAHMDKAALAALGRVDVHEYGDDTHPAALHSRVAALGKPLWASEVGCCLDSGKSEIWGALYMAAAIQTALRDLAAEAWCFWQTDWGVVDTRSGHARPLKQFYAIAQFTRFIRPGFIMLAVQGDDTVAALAPDRRRVVVVTINRAETDESQDLDLSALHRAGAAVTVYRTSAAADDNLTSGVLELSETGHLLVRQPALSVMTFVIDGTPIATHAALGSSSRQ